MDSQLPCELYPSLPMIGLCMKCATWPGVTVSSTQHCGVEGTDVSRAASYRSRWMYRSVEHSGAQVFFALMALCACCSPVFNYGFWGFKFMLWAALMIATLFITNDVFDTSGYVWVARIGAFIFTIMQQIVLIDLAYRYVRPSVRPSVRAEIGVCVLWRVFVYLWAFFRLRPT